jgi:hypothetical protein
MSREITGKTRVPGINRLTGRPFSSSKDAAVRFRILGRIFLLSLKNVMEK